MITDAFELTEDGKVILKDAELFEAIRQAEELGSSEEGLSPDKTRRGLRWAGRSWENI